LKEVSNKKQFIIQLHSSNVVNFLQEMGDIEKYLSFRQFDK
jgi:hypothetical protein